MKIFVTLLHKIARTSSPILRVLHGMHPWHLNRLVHNGYRSIRCFHHNIPLPCMVGPNCNMNHRTCQNSLFLDKKVPPQNLHTQVFCLAPPPEHSSAWLSLAIIIGQGERVPRLFMSALFFLRQKVGREKR